MNRILVAVLFAVLLLAAGCGVNKAYVAEQISSSEARTSSQLSAVSDKTDVNAAEVTKLRQLARELDEKADLAIDKAAGFENYQIIWSGEINFNFDSYDVDDVAASILDEAGVKLEQVTGSIIELTGHSDATGSAKYNLLLGEKRANSAKLYLAENFGISLYRMFTISYGENKPVALPDEKNASSKNRRVSLAVWGML